MRQTWLTWNQTPIFRESAALSFETWWERSTCYVSVARLSVAWWQKLDIPLFNFHKAIDSGEERRRGEFLRSSERSERGTETFPDCRSYGFFLPEVLYSVGRRHQSVWFIRVRSTKGSNFPLSFFFPLPPLEQIDPVDRERLTCPRKQVRQPRAKSMGTHRRKGEKLPAR